MHIDACPHQPHTKDGHPNHDPSQSDAFLFRDVGCLLDKEGGGDHTGGHTNHEEGDGPYHKAVG